MTSKNRSSQKSFPSLPSFGNRYVKTFIVSLVMAFFFVFTIYGIYGMLLAKKFPIPIAVVFLLLAIFFVIGYDFSHSRLARKSTALIVGFAASFCITVIISALIQFALMVYHGTVLDSGGWQIFVGAVAFCLIVSVIILKYAENY
jgi:cation transport ATPase